MSISISNAEKEESHSDEKTAQEKAGNGKFCQERIYGRLTVGIALFASVYVFQALPDDSFPFP